MSKRKQIVALGGGGFSQEPENLALDRYILAQTGRESPRLKLFPEDLAASERNGLTRQVRQAEELAEKAQGGLQWRRGKA